MSKLLIPANSKFNALQAMELANLIQRAYEQYNFNQKHPKNQTWEPEISEQLTGSTTCDSAISTDDAPVLNPSRNSVIEYEILSVLKFTEDRLFSSETVPFGFIAKHKIATNLTTNAIPDIFIVLRGTLNGSEWFDNFEFEQVPFLNRKDLGFVSFGFNKIYTRSNQNINSIRQEIIATLNDQPKDSQIFVTGHSLGAALATLATVDIAANTIFKKPILYTYASPRVGDPKFAEQFRQRELEHYRIANSEDLVSAVPPATGRLLGPEMYGEPIPQVNNAIATEVTPSRARNSEFLRRLANTFRRNLTQQVYEHVGEPLYFTDQKGYMTTNHNMFDVYRRALPQRLECENSATGRVLVTVQGGVKADVES